MQILTNSEKSETVPLIQYMNKDVPNQGKNQLNRDSVKTSQIPYQKL